MNQVPDKLHSFLISRVHSHIDFFDIYETHYKATKPVEVEVLVKEFFFCIPQSAAWLMAVREFIAARIGLKTAGGKKLVLEEIQAFRGQAGEKIALFEVWSRNSTEIVTGQRDKHLDFALSFYIETGKDKHVIKLITAVQINSFLGKVYMFMVKPVHQLLMPAVLKRLCKRLIIAAN